MKLFMEVGFSFPQNLMEYRIGFYFNLSEDTVDSVNRRMRFCGCYENQLNDRHRGPILHSEKKSFLQLKCVRVCLHTSLSFTYLDMFTFLLATNVVHNLALLLVPSFFIHSSISHRLFIFDRLHLTIKKREESVHEITLTNTLPINQLH